MKRTILVGGCAALALAACGKKAENATSEAAPAAAVAEATAAPTSPPARKAGLWAQTLSMAKMSQTIKLCIDPTVDAKMNWAGQQSAQSNCKDTTITPHPGGGGWDISSVCDNGESGTSTTKGVVSGDFDSHYKVDVTTTTTGASAPQMNGEHKVAIDATWQGPCPADMKPGDMAMSDGMKMNVVTGAMSSPGATHGAPSQADIAKYRAQAAEMAKAQQK